MERTKQSIVSWFPLQLCALPDGTCSSNKAPLCPKICRAFRCRCEHIKAPYPSGHSGMLVPEESTGWVRYPLDVWARRAPWTLLVMQSPTTRQKHTTLSTLPALPFYCFRAIASRASYGTYSSGAPLSVMRLVRRQ